MSLEDSISGLYTDRYQLAMAYSYWKSGRAEEPAVFDYFFRRLPYNGGYAVFAGLGTLVELLTSFRFSDEEIRFLEKEGFDQDFLGYLAKFQFKGNLWAPPEGEIIFPVEPIARVEGGLIETQLIETLLLNVLNFQSLIATKACRCRMVAGNRSLSEFGLRRAQGLAGRWASRAAVVGGFDSTSNLDAAKRYGIQSIGTMAHSFVQSFDSEITAFRDFASTHKSDTVLLLDTYDTLGSGLGNAIRVAKELASKGHTLKGVRLDSGDLAYLSKQVRKCLDTEGFSEVKIVVSNQIDEHLIRSLFEQGAEIDVFGIGTSLVTGHPDAALDGVYKLSQMAGQPRMKFSDSIGKVTLPGIKSVTRFVDSEGLFAADAIHLITEKVPIIMIHPSEPRKRLELESLQPSNLLQKVLERGEIFKEMASCTESYSHLKQRIKMLPHEHIRIENPHTYKVGISENLFELRANLLENSQRKGIS